jgi:hypothetical protein
MRKMVRRKYPFFSSVVTFSVYPVFQGISLFLLRCADPAIIDGIGGIL